MDELVKRLRAQAVYLPEKFSKNAELLDVLMKAADAIEEMQKAVPKVPHGRLGDLDKLEQMFSDIDHAPYSGFDGSEPFYSAEDAAQIIRLAPTIIPAEEGE